MRTRSRTTRSETIKWSVGRQARTEEVSALGGRLNARESSTNNRVPEILVRFENIRQLLDNVEEGSHRQTRATHTQE